METNSQSDRPLLERLMDRIVTGIPDSSGFDEAGQQHEARHISSLELAIFACIVFLGFEVVNYAMYHSGLWFTTIPRIPVRGKHLDKLEFQDWLFINFNRLCNVPFVYFYLRYALKQPNVEWEIAQISFTNLMVPLPVMFLVYDFFYTILHGVLHIKAVYGYIHKHHHRQKAPSRANVDAVNVHPIEYVLGEYNHLLSLVICSQFMHIHVTAALLFLVFGGCITALNHTRYDVCCKIPMGGNGNDFVLFDTKVHDVHHRIPQSNYGQYTMFWDHIFGTFRPYDPEDRVNPKAQLNPTTMMSFEYEKLQKER